MMQRRIAERMKRRIKRDGPYLYSWETAPKLIYLCMRAYILFGPYNFDGRETDLGACRDGERLKIIGGPTRSLACYV